MANPSAAYVPCPTLDQMHAQKSLGPTPFASEMVPNASYESATVAKVRDKRGGEGTMSCKMNYPSTLRSMHELPQTIPASRTDSNFFKQKEASVGKHRLATNVTETATPATHYWQEPPPSFEKRENPLTDHKKLPRDTFHPLLSALQASENTKAAFFQPEVAYLASATRKEAPCARHQPSPQQNAGPSQGQNTETTFADFDGDGDGEASPLGATRVNRQFSRKGDTKTAVGRAYNSEGGFHDPEQYSSKIIEFASTQPNSLTGMAAKALASAIHDRPSHSIPANVMRSRASRCLPNSGPHGTNANRHEFAGLRDDSNTILPPTASYRNLSEELRGVLQKRERDTRFQVAEILEKRYTPIMPPPTETFEKLDPHDVHVPDTVLSNRKMPHVDDDDEEELDYVSDQEMDPMSAVTPGSFTGIWRLAMRHKGPRRQDHDVSKNHPAQAVTAGKQLKVLTPQVISMHHDLSSKAQVSSLLNGVGIRMATSLTQTKPPSQSSFTESPHRLLGVKQFTNIAVTPSNTFGFDNERLQMLLSDKGEEIEDINFEGCRWLSDAALRTIARFCSNLRLLNLADCEQLTDATLIDIAKKCKQLAYINVSGCTQISGASVAAILDNNPNLYAFCASGLPLLDETAEIAFARAFMVPGLGVLDLSYCENLTDAALVCVAEHCRSLEMLNVSGCPNITDVGVSSISNSLTALKVLKLKLCSQLTPASLSSLTNAARNLHSLDIAGCIKVAPATLSEIVKRMPCAQSINLGGCPLIDDSAIDMIQRYCRGLKSLNLSSCIGVSLASCMLLIHELTNLRRLTVSESSISNAEVVMLSALRESCKIVRNQFRPEKTQRINAYKKEEKKKKKKPADDKKKR